MNQNMPKSLHKGSPIKQYSKTFYELFLSFHNRADRKEYLVLFIGLQFFTVIIFLIPFALAFEKIISDDVAVALIGIGFIASIASNLALIVRRLHDINLSGYWAFLLLIPYAGALVMLLMCLFVPGTRGDNQYGQGPVVE